MTALCVTHHAPARPTTFGVLVCLACWTTTTSGLRAIPAAYDDLLWPPRRGSGPRVTCTTEPRLPLPDEAGHARYELERVTSNWARTTATLTGAPSPEGVPARARYLLTHATTLLAAEAHAATFVADVRAVTSEAQGVAYSGRRSGVHLGRCACGGSVRAEPGEPMATCPACRSSRTVGEWRALLRPEIDTPMTSRDLRSYLHARTGVTVTCEQLRQWAVRGHVTRAGKDERGRRVYDVVTALVHVGNTTRDERIAG